MERITPRLVRQMLPPRRADGHKGTFGRVYLCGGCPGYTGAPVYAGEAAVRTGSGLVFVGVPEEVYPIAAARCRDAMVQPLPREDGALLERMAACGAALIGPGLGRAAATEARVLYLLERLQIPVVLDADGINAVSAHIDGLDGRRAVTVVTPHEGEFARLDPSFSPGAGREERERAAAAFARRHGCVVVLKGPGTIVASPDGRQRRHPGGDDTLPAGPGRRSGRGRRLRRVAPWPRGRSGGRGADGLRHDAHGPAGTPARRVQRTGGLKRRKDPCEKRCFLHQC